MPAFVLNFCNDGSIVNWWLDSEVGTYFSCIAHFRNLSMRLAFCLSILSVALFMGPQQATNSCWGPAASVLPGLLLLSCELPALMCNRTQASCCNFHIRFYVIIFYLIWSHSILSISTLFNLAALLLYSSITPFQGGKFKNTPIRSVFVCICVTCYAFLVLFGCTICSFLLLVNMWHLFILCFANLKWNRKELLSRGPLEDILWHYLMQNLQVTSHLWRYILHLVQVMSLFEAWSKWWFSSAC